MPRSLGTSGGNEHVALVQLACKKIIEDFPDLRYILVSFDEHEAEFNIRIQDKYEGFTNSTFSFRPDILIRVLRKRDESDTRKKWRSILDSAAIMFEAEIDPRNIFKNILKLAAYKKMKADSFGREAFAFVLVCWSDAQLPKNIEPFDDVWKFGR